MSTAGGEEGGQSESDETQGGKRGLMNLKPLEHGVSCKNQHAAMDRLN